MSNFTLINPSIQGNLKTTVSAKTPLLAAKETWSNLSKYFTNYVPTFAFTLENQDGGMFHFKVEESQKDGDAKFKIDMIESKLKKDDQKKFRSRINNLPEMKGGKKHKKDDDDTSSSSDGFDTLKAYKHLSKRIEPITYWWYDPYVYTLPSVYIPTLIPTVVPYVEIATVGYYVY